MPHLSKTALSLKSTKAPVLTSYFVYKINIQLPSYKVKYYN